MKKICRVHVLQALQYLVDDVLLVNVFQDVSANYSMQVSVHEVEYQVDVAVVLGADHVLQADDVLVAGELLQEDNFSECALRIRCILECIEVLLQSHYFLGLLINSLPHNTVSSLAYNIN